METEKSFEWLFHQISLNTDGFSLAEWKKMTGDGFSFFKDFLYATKKLADRIPCHLSDPYSGCKGMFIVGKYGYCSARYDRNGQKKVKSLIEPADDVEYYDYTDAYLEQETHCDVMTINPADLQCFDFDFKAFWKSAIENSPIWRDVSFNYGIRFMHQNGLYELGVCKNDEIKKYRLFFLLTWDDVSLNTGIDYLNNRVEGKYALIVPSSFNENARNKINSISTGSVIINLDDILLYDNDGFIYENEIGETIRRELYGISTVSSKYCKSSQADETEDTDAISELEQTKGTKQQSTDNIFHYDDSPKAWRIRYGDDTPLDINHEIGLLYIAILLNFPRKEIASTTLTNMASSYLPPKRKRSKMNEQSVRENISEFYDKQNSIATNIRYEGEDKDENEDENEGKNKCGYDKSIRIVNDPNQELTEGFSESLRKDIRRLENDLKTIEISLDEAKKHKDNDAMMRGRKIRNEILEDLNKARGKWIKWTLDTKAVSTAINRALKNIRKKRHPNLAQYLDDNIKISFISRFIQHNEDITWDVILPSTNSETDTN